MAELLSSSASLSDSEYLSRHSGGIWSIMKIGFTDTSDSKRFTRLKLPKSFAA